MEEIFHLRKYSGVVLVEALLAKGISFVTTTDV